MNWADHPVRPFTSHISRQPESTRALYRSSVRIGLWPWAAITRRQAPAPSPDISAAQFQCDIERPVSRRDRTATTARISTQTPWMSPSGRTNYRCFAHRRRVTRQRQARRPDSYRFWKNETRKETGR